MQNLHFSISIKILLPLKFIIVLALLSIGAGSRKPIKHERAPGAFTFDFFFQKVKKYFFQKSVLASFEVEAVSYQFW